MSGEKRKGKRERYCGVPAFLLSLFSFLSIGGCASLNTRPNYRPFPLASFDTLVGDPAAIIEAAKAGATAAGLVVAAESAEEGYLETRWFDLSTRRSHRSNIRPERLVRMRVWTDLVTPRESQVVVETVYRMTVDPSVPDREVELVAAPGTPADSLTLSVRDALRKQFTAPRSTPAIPQ